MKIINFPFPSVKERKQKKRKTVKSFDVTAKKINYSKLYMKQVQGGPKGENKRFGNKYL